MAKDIVEIRDSAHSHIVVARREGWIDLDVEGATFASYHPEHLFTGYSWDALTASCLCAAEVPERVLLLGLGGGTVARQLRFVLPQVEITALELDPMVVELAKKYMALDEIGVEVVVGDAFAFVEKTTRRFDAIIDDLFLCGEEDVYRPQAVAGAWLDTLAARLRPGGMAVANLITDHGHKTVGQVTRDAFGQAFAHARRCIPPLGLNETAIGSHHPLAEENVVKRRLASLSAADREAVAGLTFAPMV